MSNTEYARPHLLRLADDERDDLARLVMAGVEDLSHAMQAGGGGSREQQTKLRRLRSLLERLSD